MLFALDKDWTRTGMARWLLKRTTTETFEVNIDALDPFYTAGMFTETLDRILGRGGGQMARDAENWIIGQFDMHEGSQFGDKLFSSRADYDYGLELIYDEED